MEYFGNQNGRFILQNLFADVQLQSGKGDGEEDRLIESFSRCGERLMKKDPSFSEGLYLLGLALVDEMGGPSGTMWGTMFIEFSEACSSSRVTKEIFLTMLDTAVQELEPICRTGSCAESLLSVLSPLAAAFREAVSEGMSFRAALSALRQKAQDIRVRGGGSDATLCAAVFESLSASIPELIIAPLDNDMHNVL